MEANVVSTVALAEQEGAESEEITDALERLAETYWPDKEEYRFRSHADNLVAKPSDLSISYRDD